jgi:hypothetical protein
MLFYSIYNYCQKKENSQYAFLSVFKSLKEWREKLSIYQNIISDNKFKTTDKSSSLLSSPKKVLDKLINKSEVSEEIQDDTINNALKNDKKFIVKITQSKKNLFFNKIKNGFIITYINYYKYKNLSLNKLKSLKIIPIHQSFIYNYLRNQYYFIQYLLISHSNQWKERVTQIGKLILPIKKKNNDKHTFENENNIVYQNDITKIFNTTFDNLIENSINEDYIDPCFPKESISSLSPSLSLSSSNNLTDKSSSTCSINNSIIPKNTTVKLKKFHFDYYSKKIIFHPNSLYYEQNAKKYNTLEANFEKDLQFSSVTIVLTTGNQKKLPYFPRFPWYWDGVELFTGISIRPKPFYHPDYLSINWKPKKNFIKSNDKTTTLIINNTSSLKLINENLNRQNFTLSLARTN